MSSRRNLLAAYHQLAAHPGARPGRPNFKVGPPARAHAASTAVGVSAAVSILGRPDTASAADAMRWLVSSARDCGMSVRPSNIGWGRDITPTLGAVQLTALAESLQPSDQLRYRTATPVPRHPSPGSARADRLARRVPPLLWSAWSLRLAIPTCHQRRLRLALSTALLLIDTRLWLQDAADLLGAATSGHGVSGVVQLLQKRAEWPDICMALTRLADYLTDNEVPIDYQRRRQLDYATLLPDRVWSFTCRDTGTPGGRPTVRARIARCHLFERLSDLPERSSVICCAATPLLIGASQGHSQTLADTTKFLLARNEVVKIIDYMIEHGAMSEQVLIDADKLDAIIETLEHLRRSTIPAPTVTTPAKARLMQYPVKPAG